MTWGQRRKAWTVIAAGLGAWACVGVIGWLVFTIVFTPGCVSAWHKSSETTAADGTKTRTSSTGYRDMREGAKGAGDLLTGLGDGLLGAGGLTGLLSGGGVVGALGLLWRNAAVHKARKQGEDAGYEYAKGVYSPPPPRTTPDPGTGSVTEHSA